MVRQSYKFLKELQVLFQLISHIKAGVLADIVGEWASPNPQLDAVVWTSLPPKFAEVDGKVPTVEMVITHIQNLPQPEREKAVRYIRETPPQIKTGYRERLEKAFG